MNDEEQFDRPRVKGDREEKGVLMDEAAANIFLETYAGRTVEQAIEAGQAYRKGDKLYIKKQ